MHVVTFKPNDSKGKSTFALFVGQHKVSDHQYLPVCVPGDPTGARAVGGGPG